MTGRPPEEDPVPLDEVDDARISGDHVVLRLRSGRLLRMKLGREALELYWRVKLRNRRRAFGL